jgi:YYY domain-containing protein
VIDSLRWLAGLELLGLTFLPLTGMVLGRLRDGGYAFSRVLGLLLVTYATWLVGSFLPIARSPVLPAVAVVLGLAGWVLWRQSTLARIRAAWKIMAAEEAVFVAGFVAWALLRVSVFGTGANHTEQFMDMALLNASYHSASFPAYDPWMSGHTINYYYFGYLMWATFTKLVGVAPVVAFNLANVSLFALVVSCAYSLGISLTGSRIWGGLAPLFLAVVGNLHEALWGAWHGLCGQAPASAVGFFYANFWPSTRVIGSDYTLSNWSCTVKPGSGPNIDEYPLFSFILGDLHPHVMALPLVLLTIALALSYVLGSRRRLASLAGPDIAYLVLLAIAAGALFVTNSWDYPAYVLVMCGAIAVRAYVEDPAEGWWQRPAAAVIALGILSVALYAPFYLHFSSLSGGIGLVSTTADLFEFLQVFGLFLAGGVLLVGALYLLLQPEPERVEALDIVSEAGEARAETIDRLLMVAAAAAVLVAASIAHRLTLICLLGLAAAALLVAYRVLNTEEPNRSDALALLLVAVGCIAAAIPEVVYLRDAFAGGTSYRMNTIFKFYYQAWVLLGLASAYGAYRSWSVLRALGARAWAWSGVGLIAVLALGAAVYTAWIPSAGVNRTSPATLSAAAWINSDDPGDARAIAWLDRHAQPQQVVLEAVGTDYETNGTIISTFTGLPTVMGWQGHELQWRPNDPDVQTRVDDVKTMYTTRSIGLARQLLRKYNVRYVLVGEAETERYGSETGGLTKFGSFMRVAYSTRGATLYSW